MTVKELFRITLELPSTVIKAVFVFRGEAAIAVTVKGFYKTVNLSHAMRRY
ncbi:MAG: hypothetical protein R3C28_06725 [Pirellulaceae bacterium]